MPLDQDCRGITTSGLRYPLHEEPLLFGHTRGVSNEPIAAEVRVTVASGALLLTRHFTRL
jgi:thiamine pyrophosphokinase